MRRKKSERSCRDRSHKDLALAADIPELHLKCKRNTNGCDKQRDRDLNRLVNHSL